VRALFTRHWTGAQTWRQIGAVAVALALIAGLTSCRLDTGTAGPSGTQPISTTITVPSSLPASTRRPVASPAAAAPAAGESGLARVSSDLAGIDSANSQAGTDLSAGEAAQSQPDNP
jgi:hypothetical protein